MFTATRGVRLGAGRGMMFNVDKSLISRPTMRAFRELASGWEGLVVRAIHDLWQDEGFAPDWSEVEAGEAQRRGTYQAYLNGVDWSDYGAVTRAVRVFESTIRASKRPPYGEDDKWLWELRPLLERDGYDLDDHGRITARLPTTLTAGALNNLADATAIRTALQRISNSIESDPALAIGTAKELIESTAKVVLTECHESWSDRDDITDLIRRAQQVLMLQPRKSTAGPDGSEGLRKVLGGLTSIAVGIAELRNRGFGSGHGAASAPTGLRARHARLCVSAATVWCQTMLETLADEEAPWRASATSLQRDESS